MEAIPQIYDIAKDLYEKLANVVAKMDNFLLEEDPFTKNETIIEMDHFVQAILLRVALADNKLYDIELDFVKDIVKLSDVFLNEKFGNLKEMTKEKKEYFVKKCDEILDKTPNFVVMAVKCDKKIDSMLKVIDPTYSQIVYDHLKRIANYLKFVDGNVQVVEDETSKIVLATVVKYFKSHYVRYAPRRISLDE